MELIKYPLRIVRTLIHQYLKIGVGHMDKYDDNNCQGHSVNNDKFKLTL